MMKSIYICVLTLACMVITSCNKLHSGKVYICVTGEVYHSNNYCKGLRNATHDIIEVDKNEAEDEYHRRACKVCYNL